MREAETLPTFEHQSDDRSVDDEVPCVDQGEYRFLEQMALQDSSKPSIIMLELVGDFIALVKMTLAAPGVTTQYCVSVFEACRSSTPVFSYQLASHLVPLSLHGVLFDASSKSTLSLASTAAFSNLSPKTTDKELQLLLTVHDNTQKKINLQQVLVKEKKFKNLLISKAPCLANQVYTRVRNSESFYEIWFHLGCLNFFYSRIETSLLPIKNESDFSISYLSRGSEWAEQFKNNHTLYQLGSESDGLTQDLTDFQLDLKCPQQAKFTDNSRICFLSRSSNYYTITLSEAYLDQDLSGAFKIKPLKMIPFMESAVAYCQLVFCSDLNLIKLVGLNKKGQGSLELPLSADEPEEYQLQVSLVRGNPQVDAHDRLLAERRECSLPVTTAALNAKIEETTASELLLDVKVKAISNAFLNSDVDNKDILTGINTVILAGKEIFMVKSTAIKDSFILEKIIIPDDTLMGHQNLKEKDFIADIATSQPSVLRDHALKTICLTTSKGVISNLKLNLEKTLKSHGDSYTDTNIKTT